jgi:diguanylate cyclase (GGDEF)-like protein
MMALGVVLYSISLLSQVFAAFFAIILFFRARSYRLACGFLSIGLTLMIGRRVTPLLQALNTGHMNILDAWLSVPISVFLLLGMFQFRRLLIELEDRNFLLDQFSKTDSLTGAMSRIETLARVDLEIKKSFRTKEPIAFLMADIDHFKNVNDAYGHPIGDQVLIDLVKRSQDQLREIDIFGRVGGEEFLIVLPGLGKKSASEVAERLRMHISNKPSINVDGNDLLITISIGISIYDPQQDHEEEAGAILRKYYSLCDQAMYRAKQAGRNQVST